MAFAFHFRLAEDRKDRDAIINFLRKQPFDYKGYEDWLSRIRNEILTYKQFILAFSEDFLVGSLMFQKHKQFPRLRELKNMRIDTRAQRRYFGQFMIRQAEAEYRKDYDAIICDTRSDRQDVIALLRVMGYKELCKAPLYQSDVEDIIFVKAFEQTPEGIFAPVRKKIFQLAA